MKGQFFMLKYLWLFFNLLERRKSTHVYSLEWAALFKAKHNSNYDDISYMVELYTNSVDSPVSIYNYILSKMFNLNILKFTLCTYLSKDWTVDVWLLYGRIFKHRTMYPLYFLETISNKYSLCTKEIWFSFYFSFKLWCYA